MSDMREGLTWLLLAVAAAVGYLVIIKAIMATVL